MRLEVRCCCDAHLIGWVTVPRCPRVGQLQVFTLLGRHGFTSSAPLSVVEPLETLTFEAAVVAPGMIRRLGGAEEYLALKSRDYPIEQLRRIPGFIEATDADREAHR